MIVNEYTEYYDLITEGSALLDRIKYEYLMEVEQLNQEFNVNKALKLEQAILEQNLTPINEAAIGIAGIFNFIKKLIEAFKRFVLKIVYTAISKYKGEKGRITRKTLDSKKNNYGFEYVYLHKDVRDAADRLIFHLFYSNARMSDYDKIEAAKLDTAYYEDGADEIASSISGLCENKYCSDTITWLKKAVKEIGEADKDADNKYCVDSRVERLERWVRYAEKEMPNIDKPTSSSILSDTREHMLEKLVKTLLMESKLFRFDSEVIQQTLDEVKSKVNLDSIDFTMICNIIFNTLKDANQNLIMHSRENLMFNEPVVTGLNDDSLKIADRYRIENSVSMDLYNRHTTLMKSINPNQSALYIGKFSELIKKNFMDDLDKELKDVTDSLSPANIKKFEDAIKIISSNRSSNNGEDVSDIIERCMNMLIRIKTELESMLNNCANAITGCNKVLGTYSAITTNIINAFTYVNAKGEEFKEV